MKPSGPRRPFRSCSTARTTRTQRSGRQPEPAGRQLDRCQHDYHGADAPSALELLAEVVPKADLIGFLINPTTGPLARGSKRCSERRNRLAETFMS